MNRGTKVVVDHCSDPYTGLEPGTVGTVALVDSLGTIHVKWNDGRTLGLIVGEDQWHEATEAELASEEQEREEAIVRRVDDVVDDIEDLVEGTAKQLGIPIGQFIDRVASELKARLEFPTNEAGTGV